jgi:hypothetical protein
MNGFAFALDFSTYPWLMGLSNLGKGGQPINRNTQEYVVGFIWKEVVKSG